MNYNDSDDNDDKIEKLDGKIVKLEYLFYQILLIFN